MIVAIYLRENSKKQYIFNAQRKFLCYDKCILNLMRGVNL